ncbi:MAG: SH3 domain-containing protein [Bacteroidia bacterium]
MNRYFILSVTLLLLSMSATAQDIYIVTADKLNVRETKDPSSKKIGFVPQDERVAVLDSSDTKYYKIQVTNGEGWVSKDYLMKIEKAPSTNVQIKTPLIKKDPVQTQGNIIFISLAGLVAVILIALIIKFVPNKIYMALYIGVIITIGYFFYHGFIATKNVSGKYVTNDDLQYKSFDFKTKDSVIIHDSYMDSLTTVPYTIDGDMIKFKQQENTFILVIRDETTLMGEGFTKGTFIRN